MTPESKKSLSTTIRALRERLLVDLHQATESKYRMGVHRRQDAGLDEANRELRKRLEDYLKERVRADGGDDDGDDDETAASPAASPVGSGPGKSASGKQPASSTSASGTSASPEQTSDSAPVAKKTKTKATAKKKPKKKRLTAAERKAKKMAAALAAAVVGRKGKRTREDFRLEVEQQAAYTLLNRLVVLRLMEAQGLRREKVLTGGWESSGYRTFRQLAPALCQDPADASEGYAFLLQLCFEELAQDLPGLFDRAAAGFGSLVPVPASTLRHLVEALDQPELAPCWKDDMTLGWVYQYWNDPEREALDAKINARGKIEPHEIASKTQMFTERYMVDWLLQNSLGPMWLAICARNKWTPEVERDGVLAALEARRVDWRGKRDREEVDLTALMPLYSDAERRWAYYVPQPLPKDAVEQAPKSVRDLKLLDPAVGSGHFLVVAFDLLVALYREEARHRGIDGAEDAEWSKRAIAERILESNLHGIDIDPRAAQIAAAALWLKAQSLCPEAQPRRMWLVASDLRLAGLPADDPALVELRAAVELETGIVGELTDKIVHGLAGADHLGSLLRVEKAVDEAIEAHDAGPSRWRKGKNLELFTGEAEPEQRELIDAAQARETILELLEKFLLKHTRGDDLGLRLRGEQLAAGVRFIRMVRPGTYDLVVGNPPYQGTTKMAETRYVELVYPTAKADLYAAFIQRGLQLVREGGVSALLTMRNWMFIKQYAELRIWLLKTYDLRILGDFDRGAFEDVPDEVVSVVVSVFYRTQRLRDEESVAHQPTPAEDRSRDGERTLRKRAATLSGVGRVPFRCETLRVVPEWPIVYWWNRETLLAYAKAEQLGKTSPCKVGIVTGDNTRFVRKSWELVRQPANWVPFVSGARGAVWIDPCDDRLKWHNSGSETKTLSAHVYGSHTRQVRNEELYFVTGIACTAIGATFGARVHR